MRKRSAALGLGDGKRHQTRDDNKAAAAFALSPGVAHDMRMHAAEEYPHRGRIAAGNVPRLAIVCKNEMAHPQQHDTSCRNG